MESVEILENVELYIVSLECLCAVATTLIVVTTGEVLRLNRVRRMRRRATGAA